MAKQTDETIPVSFRFNGTLNDKLTKYCREASTSKTEFIEKLIRDKLDGRLHWTDEVANHLGFDDEEVLDQGRSVEAQLARSERFPLELQWAIVDFLAALWRRRTALVKSAMTPYRIVKYPYVRFDQLGDAVEGAAWQLAETLGNFSISEFRDNEYFDVTQRPDLLYDTPLLFAFPFYLTESRRSSFGVLPYGDHHSIGLLLHKNAFHGAFGAASQDDVAKDLGIFRKGFNVFLSQMANQSGKIHHFQGFIYDEIFPHLVSYYGSPETKQSFYELGKVREPVENVRSLHEEALKVMRKAEPSSLFALDLIVAEEIERGLKKERDEFVVLRVAHNQRIPVGIGFTLPLLPRLLEEGNWRALLRAAQKCLTAGSGSQDFESIGITLRQPGEPNE